MVHHVGEPGTLRRAAGDVGIPAISYEAGEPMRFQPAEVDEGVRGVLDLLARKGMLSSRPRRGQRQEIYYRARWVRVDDGGILLSDVELGDAVKAGDVLGVVTDPISNERTIVRSPYDGRVIGMALDQVVIPGFAAFHIGSAATTSGAGRGAGGDPGGRARQRKRRAPERGAARCRRAPRVGRGAGFSSREPNRCCRGPAARRARPLDLRVEGDRARSSAAATDAEGLWRVELEITARGTGQRGSVRAPLPSTGRAQDVFDERSTSDRLLFTIRTENGERIGVWSGRLSGVHQLVHGFRVQLSERLDAAAEPTSRASRRGS